MFLQSKPSLLDYALQEHILITIHTAQILMHAKTSSIWFIRGGNNINVVLLVAFN